MLLLNIPDFVQSLPAKGRLIAFDVGLKKIGVALSDHLRIIASPCEIYPRINIRKDINKALSYIRQHEGVGIILGLPLNLEGQEGEMGDEVKNFATKLAKESDIPLYLQDERFSTKQSAKIMSDYGLSWQKKAKVEDKIAASFILQSAIDQINYYLQGDN